MAGVVHKLDPNPDTVIILEDPTADFAVWDVGDDTLVEDVSEPTTKSSRTQSIAVKVCRRDYRRVLGDGPAATESQGSSAGSASTTSRLRAGHTDDDPEHAESEDGDSSNSIQYLVSSRHLILASPWFQRALTREGWTESDRDADGRYCIRTSGWDSEALLILLNILHLRNRQVPRTLSLEMLAKIAVLVDYYECAEAIDLFGEVWTKTLEETPVPTELGRDLVLWVWVAWSFKLSQKFEEATFAAVKYSIGDFDALELPIPTAVIEAIEKVRQCSMLEIQSGLTALLDEYRSKDYSCPVNRASSSFECGSIMYGALSKGMDTIGLSADDELFDGLSLDDICTDMRNIRSPTWYHGGSSGYYQSQHMCNLNRAVRIVADEVEKSLKGLKLEDMKKEC